MPVNSFTIEASSTSKNVFVFLRDNSVSYPKGKTGLAYNTASFTCYYIRQGQSSATAVTLVAGTLGTYLSSSFIAVDGTNLPGMYQFSIPNAALTSGPQQVTFFFKGAAGLADTPVEVDLVGYDDSSIYSRLDTALLATESLTRLEEEVRRLSLVVGAKRRT